MVANGIPEHIRSDNGPEFVAKDLRQWLVDIGAKTLYIEPGSPWENGYCESFNSKLRDEFLNGEIFYSMKELRVLAGRWRGYYNAARPHSSLGYKPPAPEAWLTSTNKGHGKVESKKRYHFSTPRLRRRDESISHRATLTLHWYKRSGRPYLEHEGSDAPKIEEGDIKAIGSPLDFVGLNVYTPTYVRADRSARGYAVEQPQASFPHMASHWLSIGPECLYWAVRNVCELWKPRAIYITENGCSTDDVVTLAGRIEDTDRVMYLRNLLTHLHRAVEEDYPVKGYFPWNLLDNFEWTDGYSKRFGIHYVDFTTQKRTPKLSAEWYREVIARNTLE